MKARKEPRDADMDAPAAKKPRNPEVKSKSGEELCEEEILANQDFYLNTREPTHEASNDAVYQALRENEAMKDAGGLPFRLVCSKASSGHVIPSYINCCSRATLDAQKVISFNKDLHGKWKPWTVLPLRNMSGRVPIPLLPAPQSRMVLGIRR